MSKHENIKKIVYNEDLEGQTLKWISDKQALDFFVDRDSFEFVEPLLPLGREGGRNSRILVTQWIYEIIEECDLDSALLYMCVTLYDRFVTKKKFTKDEFELKNIQRFATAAMTLSSRFLHHDCENYLNCHFGVKVTGGLLKTIRELVDLEFDLLETLDYHIDVVTPWHIIDRVLFQLEIYDNERLREENDRVLFKACGIVELAYFRAALWVGVVILLNYKRISWGEEMPWKKQKQLRNLLKIKNDELDDYHECYRIFETNIPYENKHKKIKTEG